MREKNFSVIKIIYKYILYKVTPVKLNIRRTVSSFEKSINTLREETNGLIGAINQIESIHGKNEEAEELASIFAFVNLSMIDIILLFNIYIKTNSVDEKHLICRTAALHMYEFLEDGSRIFGTGMKNLASTIKANSIDEEILAIRKLFFSIRKNNIETLKVIRNNVSGHKDRNVRMQISVNENIDVENFDSFFLQFFMLLFPYADLKRKLKPILK